MWLHSPIANEMPEALWAPEPAAPDERRHASNVACGSAVGDNPEEW
jgi:hypothetical protein